MISESIHPYNEMFPHLHRCAVAMVGVEGSPRAPLQ